MRTFRSIYLDICSAAVARQASDGRMPAGHNGHYHDPETPVRNTSHYIIAFLRAWELSDDSSFLEAAKRSVDWLIKSNPYRGKYNFQHRSKPGKDLCNGLIGPAWVIEALLFSEKYLEIREARELARDLFNLHPFNSKTKVWDRVEPDGSRLSFDMTFNHQLWFAACASPLITDTPEAEERIGAFADNLPDLFDMAASGRIVHPLWVRQRRLRERVKRAIKPAHHQALLSKEIGYHAFNLLGFSIMKLGGVSLNPKVLSRIEKAIEYLNTNEYLNGIESSECGFPYNPPGWEVPMAKSVLAGGFPAECTVWIQRQLAYSFDSSNRMMSHRTDDPETQTARIYEASRLRNEFFDLELQA
ncbi:MAG: hypothetical protein AAGJ81_05080 [Verrucomicrobiota bacterium]